MSTKASDNQMDYPQMVQDALRGFVRSVLVKVAAEGLEAPHQLYLTLRPDAPGVQLPAFLREAYPSSLTVVLENQFWDLDIAEESFAVTLRFGGTPHRLVVPFAAITAFVDPGVEFGLSFEKQTSEDETDEDTTAAEAETDSERPTAADGHKPGGVVQFDAFRRRRPPS